LFLAHKNAEPGWESAVARFLAEPSDDSFYAVFRVIAPRLITYFRAHGCGVELAEDLTQEVMLAVYLHAGKLRQEELFLRWTYRIARNAIRRHVRDSSRRITTVESDRDAESICDRDADPVLHRQFVEWMEWLNSDEREIMMLRYVDDLEHHEIAAVLGMPQGTVQWKIFHAKRKLAAHFGKGAT
jgi:RNA polymerase sigma-70 factor (ECF subfamily)